jgi:RNA polymerase sigma factor (sigma-70 family)
MRKLAAKLLRDKDERADLVTDTIIHCLGHWRGYREDGGFWNWIYWCMRGVHSNKRMQRDRHPRLVEDPDGAIMDSRYTSPSQITHVELSQTLDTMNTRAGKVLLRRAMTDDTLLEIAADMGISKERVRQLETQERERLLAARAA